MTALTNILATLIIAVTTNTYHPTQYWDTSYSCPVYAPQQTRQNPDVRITEVTEVRTLEFEFEGTKYSVEVGRKTLSKTRQLRKVWVDDDTFFNDQLVYTNIMDIVTNHTIHVTPSVRAWTIPAVLTNNFFNVPISNLSATNSLVVTTNAAETRRQDFPRWSPRAMEIMQAGAKERAIFRANIVSNALER